MTNFKNFLTCTFFALSVLVSALTLSANDNKSPYNVTDEYFLTTIILINGIPFLVELDREGDVVFNYTEVSDYFDSSEPHESMVSRLSHKYDSEFAFLQNSRLIIFQENLSMLNSTAIDNIRDVARLYNQGFLQNINITASHEESRNDETLASYRVDAISQLLIDFGVRKGDISADMKIYKSDIPNQFVKIDLLK